LKKATEKTETLFDLSEYDSGIKGRKRPETKAEKILSEIKNMRERDFLNLKNKLNRGQPLTSAERKVLDQYYQTIEASFALPPGYVRTVAEVAAHFKRTDRSIWNWKGRGMPQTEIGYDLNAIETWAAEQGLIGKNGDGSQGPQTEKEGQGSTSDAEFWRAEFRKNKAKLAEIELKLKQGELLHKVDVISAFRDLQSYVRKHLSLVYRVAPPRMVGMDSKAQSAVLKEIIETIMAGMAKGQSTKKIEAILVNGK